ncbi:MAG TPA: Gfo/Idh/MocA family oxidoreductase [Candidatus Marinimicrobia bacterium]|nr:Gfo/Idh/MocA family oxidoreductase [Candidatus Neomarinimicrobiota bacterium]
MSAKQTKTIRWGMIGCGAVTEIKSGPAFQLAENSELTAVMCRRLDKAGDYAQRHQIPFYTDDTEKLLSREDLDAVYIATPPDSHAYYTQLAAQYGKAIYVEKPMARTFAECKAMLAVTEKAGLPLYVAYYRRALPRFLKIKEILDAGRIGSPRIVTIQLYRPPFPADLEGKANWRTDPKIAGCGYFCDLAVHTLDILQWLLGKIQSVESAIANQLKIYTAEDTVSARFTFPNDVHATGIWNFTAYSAFDQNEIIGDKGKICFSTFGDSPIELHASDKVETFSIANPRHIQLPFIQKMVNALLEKEPFAPNGKSAAHTNWLLDQIIHPQK